MDGSSSHPNDKIATDLGSKTTTNNRTATGVISATGPHLLKLTIFTLLALYLFLVAMLRSSCTLSSSHIRNSCASCWAKPRYWLPYFPTTALKSLDISGTYCPDQRLFSNIAICSVSSPFVPNRFALILLFRLISCLYWSQTKYSASTAVWHRHCKTAFIKHVLPWFRIPVIPGILCLLL